MYVKKYRLRQEIIGDDYTTTIPEYKSTVQDSLDAVKNIEIEKILTQRKQQEAYQDSLAALPPFIKAFNRSYSSESLSDSEEVRIKANLANDYNTKL